MPQCGYSGTLVNILQSLSVPFETVDVLANDRIRQGIKVTARRERGTVGAGGGQGGGRSLSSSLLLLSFPFDTSGCPVSLVTSRGPKRDKVSLSDPICSGGSTGYPF